MFAISLRSINGPRLESLAKSEFLVAAARLDGSTGFQLGYWIRVWPEATVSPPTFRVNMQVSLLRIFELY